MEQDPSNNENTERLLAEQKKRIEALELALTELERKAARYEEGWSAQYDQNKELREENHRLQHDYEILRIQKGGFGFKMLMLSGLGGFVTALVLCFVYVKLQPKEPQVVAFRQFQRENLFNYELAISKGQFEEVEKSLDQCFERPEYEVIEPELVFMKEIVKAAKHRCR